MRIIFFYTFEFIGTYEFINYFILLIIWQWGQELVIQLTLPSSSNGDIQDSNSPTPNFLINNNNNTNNLIVGFGRKNLNPDVFIGNTKKYQLLSQVFCEYINHLKSCSGVRGLVR